MMVEPIEPKLGEPELSLEELKEREIEKAWDYEQIRERDFTKVGSPIVCVITRSVSMKEQVSSVPQYYEVVEKGRVIGYQGWGYQKQITSIKPMKPSIVILGQRERNK